MPVLSGPMIQNSKGATLFEELKTTVVRSKMNLSALISSRYNSKSAVNSRICSCSFPEMVLKDTTVSLGCAFKVPDALVVLLSGS